MKEECLTQIKTNEIFNHTALPLLEKYIFCNCSFHNVLFKEDLNHVEFINCNLYDCYFDSDSHFLGGEINNCTFSSSYFHNVTFSNNNFNNTFFIDCTMNNFSAFYNVYFKKSKFIGTNFIATTFNIYSYDKIFENCIFQKVNFTTELSRSGAITSGCEKETILRESIIGYKKCSDHIVTLEIPAGAIVFSPNGKKCRTNKVRVLKIETFFGEEDDRAYSLYNGMSYYVGDEITIHNFDLRCNQECSNGIHFFMTKEEAINYF